MKAIHLLTIYCLLVVSASIQAMSQTPEETPEAVSLEDAKAGKYGRQFENRDPEADARAAIEDGDHRLLGFATRATSVPGVSIDDEKAAIIACGVRLIEGFGDVIRSPEELAAMRQVSAYAKRYNAVIVKECFRKE